jgi:flagellin-like protein
LGDERGVSSVIGTILLIVIVLTGTTTIFLVAAQPVEETQSEMRGEQAKNTLTKFDSSTSLVALGSDGNARSSVQLPMFNDESTELLIRDDGTMNISVSNTAAGGKTVQTVDMNSLVYRTGNMEVAYQGGGVWEKTTGSRYSTMVSAPEFHYAGDASKATVTLPIIQIDDNQVGPVSSNRVQIEKVDSNLLAVPRVIQNNTVVEVEITSAYYRAWGDYFISRTDSVSVTYDDVNQKATVVLFGPDDSPRVKGGLVSAGTNLGISNNNIADSYNSSNGDYAATQASNNNVVTNRDVQLTNKASINGQLITSGGLQMTNNAEITGNAYVEQDVQLQNNAEILGNLITEGDVTLGGGSTVHGDIRAGGEVEFGSNNPTVEGSVYSADRIVMNRGTIEGDAYSDGDFEFTWGRAEVDGTINYGGSFIKPAWNSRPRWGGLASGASVSAPVVDGPPTLNAVTTLIQDKKSVVQATNDNAAVSSISGNSFNLFGGNPDTLRLEAGQYYVDSTTLGNGDELVFDTASGDIELVIDGDFQMNNDARVKVTGPNDVRVYVPDGRNYQMVNNAQSTVSGDQSPRFRVYLEPSSNVQIANNVQFTGVIYGPGGQNNGAQISVSNNADIYGALVGQIGSIPNRYGVHYDEALKNVSPTPTPAGVPITYLHVTENTVKLND